MAVSGNVEDNPGLGADGECDDGGCHQYCMECGDNVRLVARERVSRVSSLFIHHRIYCQEHSKTAKWCGGLEESWN